MASTSGGPGVLLQYYAKYLPGNWNMQPGKARAERLALDVVPRLDGDKVEMAVTFQGKPLGSAELVVIDSIGRERSLKTDEKGIAQLPAVAGRCAVRRRSCPA